MTVDTLVREVTASSDLSQKEKKRILYFLEDEDFVNERFAIMALVEMILKRKITFAGSVQRSVDESDDLSWSGIGRVD